MWQKYLQDARLFDILQRYDEDIARKRKAEGCACGGRLDCANFRRKPRGLPSNVPEDLAAAYQLRLSLCCATCRSRTTPVSVRFFGRRVYAGAVFVLISALAIGLTGKKIAKLTKTFGVDRRTLRRWRRWWQSWFVGSDFWRIARGSFSTPVAPDQLPASLLERFTGDEAHIRIRCALSFLSALSTTSP